MLDYSDMVIEAVIEAVIEEVAEISMIIIVRWKRKQRKLENLEKTTQRLEYSLKKPLLKWVKKCPWPTSIRI